MKSWPRSGGRQGQEMREIVLDTETTGLHVEDGDRVLEIGAVELWNALPTGKTYHKFINPQHPVHPDAFRVHGIGDDFLRDKPVFAEIAPEFLAFIGDARLVIHNAPFDMGMLNAELARLGHPRLPDARAVDTLEMARRAYPGAQLSLDALCKRFGIDISVREKHGALIDCYLLADVYLELQGGRQRGFDLAASQPRGSQEGTGAAAIGPAKAPRRREPLPPRITPEERAAHAAFVSELGEHALWARLASQGAAEPKS